MENFMLQDSNHIFICSFSIYFFLNCANLICRGMDISKYFKESIGLRDNESTKYAFSNLNIMSLNVRKRTFRICTH